MEEPQHYPGLVGPLSTNANNKTALPLALLNHHLMTLRYASFPVLRYIYLIGGL